MNLAKLAEFVKPYYRDKDIMHDVSHIERIIKTLEWLIKEIKIDIDYCDVVYATYFHGFIYSNEINIIKWLEDEGFEEYRINKIVSIAWESQKNKEANSFEGRLLHDAHMIEGGKVFLITKSLITGTARGQNLEETLTYIENNILGKGKCYLEKAQSIYK